MSASPPDTPAAGSCEASLRSRVPRCRPRQRRRSMATHRLMESAAGPGAGATAAAASTPDNPSKRTRPTRTKSRRRHAESATWGSRKQRKHKTAQHPRHRKREAPPSLNGDLEPRIGRAKVGKLLPVHQENFIRQLPHLSIPVLFEFERAGITLRSPEVKSRKALLPRPAQMIEIHEGVGA